MGWDTWDCSRWGRKLLMFSAPLVCQRPRQTHFHHFPDFWDRSVQKEGSLNDYIVILDTLGSQSVECCIYPARDTCVLPDDCVLVADDESVD